MKKFIALLLVVITVVVAMSSCSKSIDNVKPLDYITLGDYKTFDYSELVSNYQKERLEAAKNYTSFSVDWGTTITFNCVCEVITENGNVKTYEKYEKYCYEGDKTVTIDIYEDIKDAYRSDFDSALVYNVKKAGTFSEDTSRRTIKVGTAFDFEYQMPYLTGDDSAISGKLTRFTITPVKVIPPLYDDVSIVGEIEAFLKKHPETTSVISIGDVVTANISVGKEYSFEIEKDEAGNIVYKKDADGNFLLDDKGQKIPKEVLVMGDTVDNVKRDNITFTVGCSMMPKCFDEAMVGIGVTQPEYIYVTYPADWTDSELAGKELVYTVKVITAFNFDKAVKENTKYETFHDFKESLRLNVYIFASALDIVYDRSTMNKVPNDLYKDYYKSIKTYVDEYIIDDYISVMKYYNNETVTRDQAIAALWGSKKEYNTYLDEMATETVKDALVCYAIAEDMDIILKAEEYESQLKDFTSAFNTDYYTTYTTSQIENKFGKNYIKLMAMENKLRNLIADEIIKNAK